MTKDHTIHGTDQPNDLCWRHQITNQRTIQRSHLYVAASDKQSWKQCSCASKNTNCTEGRSHKNDVELWQMRLHETCGASAYVLAAKKDTKHPSPPEQPMYFVPCCAKRIATLWFLALLPFQQRHTRVNKQELNTPNAIARSLPVLDLPPTTLEHAPRLLSLDSGSFRKQLSHVQSNTRKIESNGEVVKHALQAQELSNRTQATLLKAQLNAMFIFWKKKRILRAQNSCGKQNVPYVWSTSFLQTMYRQDATAMFTDGYTNRPFSRGGISLTQADGI